jgi:hypothetical protein
LEKFGKGELAIAEADKQIEHVRNNLARLDIGRDLRKGTFQDPDDIRLKAPTLDAYPTKNITRRV